MSIGSFGIGGGIDIEGLVAQFRSLELRSRFRLEARLENLQTRKTALSDLDSKLSALFSITDRFAETILVDPFASRLGVTSDSDAFTVTATSAAQVGSHSISISQLASTDTRVSNQVTGINTDFSGIVTDQSFDILVAHPTDADPSNRLAVTVTVTAASFAKTNEELFDAIASAINDAIAAEISSGNLEATERVTASAVEESSGTARLILRAGLSGESNALQFTDTDGLLATLGLTTNALASGTTGGFITASADLNSEFVLDGLSFSRDSNAIDDVLDGITFQLQNVTDSDETLTVEADTDAVRSEVDSFIEAYNEALTFIRSETGAGGDFRGDPTYSLLGIELRSIAGSRVAGTSTTDYDRLLEIGIDVKNDGTLFFEDAEKFEAALAANPQLVSDIFNVSDGIATQMRDFVVGYTRTSGLISSSQRSVDTTIRHQNERLDTFDDRLERRVARFRSEMVRLQTALAQVRAQAAFFQTFRS